LSRNKKKKKIAGQNLSLTERLERHWNNEKWESFFSLYIRDRDASERGPWAARFPDALYNSLTVTLFLRKNYEGARQIAEMMLAEHALGSDGDVLRGCARTALDFINIREGKLHRPSDEKSRDIFLPELYEELRRKLADGFNTSKRGRKRKEISSPTAEKLAKQFAKLPSAKNSAPYANFLKIAEALASETKESDSAVIFRAVRDIASSMLKTARGTFDFKEPTHVIRHFGSKEYPLRTSHPALLTLWEYMCKMGGRKFGDNWENAVRAGRMSVIPMGEEFKPAYDKLMAVNKNSQRTGNGDLPVLAERHYGGWTEQERFSIIFLAVANELKKQYTFFDDIPANTILRWFKTLAEIGGRRRSERAWPDAVRFAFEKMIVVGGPRYLDILVGEDLPYECMSAVTVAVMVLYAPRTLGFVKDKLKSRLPLSMNDADEHALGNFFPATVFSVPALTAASEILDDMGKGTFFKYILLGLFRLDISKVTESVTYRPTLWNSVTQSHIALFLENLPEDSYAAAFCRLCLGQKPMSLSDDTSLIAEFFSSCPYDSSDDSFFNATLSMFLMTLPSVPVEFLLRLFEFSMAEYERLDEWESLPKLVSNIQNADDRKKVARGISLILRRRYRKNMNADAERAIKALFFLERVDRPTKQKDDGDDDAFFGGFDSDILRLLERFSKKKKKF
jgi:hypothetical protein